MRKQTYLLPYFFILPAVFYIACLVFYPLFGTIRLSMTDAKLNSSGSFVGFENYIDLLTDKRFWDTIVRTFVWTFTAVFLKMTIGLMGALLLSTSIKGIKNFKSFILPPWIVPMTIGTIFWGWMYNSEYGVFNVWLENMGLIGNPINFLGETQTAFMESFLVLS